MYRLLGLFLVLLISLSASAQNYRTIPNNYFQRGEKLEFRIAFHSALTGNITAASATVEVTDENRKFDSRDTYHVVGYGKTTGFIEMFYQIEERFESFIDEKALVPHYFIRKTRENNYRKTENVIFKHKEHIAVSESSVKNVPANIQDIFSAFYYARVIDLSKSKPGAEFPVPFYLDDSVYNSKLVFVGRETVKTKLGKFSCIKVKPMVATGYVFDDPYPVTVWVTDDQNRIPVRIESKLSVGSVRIDLTSYQGVANPVAQLK
jgi:hypothetical protein